MKNGLFCFMGLALAAVLGSGCSADGGFTAEEVKLINDGDQEVMRVLKSDVPEDLAVLRMKSAGLSDRALKSDEYDLLCRRMLMTVRSPENDGVGIAAPQVGISRRVIAVQRFDKEGEPLELYANPEIVRYGEETAPGPEGWLSVSDGRGTVVRPQEIDLRYRTVNGTDTLETVKGFTAVIFQHEIDHLDGVLFTDRASSYGNDYMRTRVLEDGAKVTWIQDNAEPRLMPRSLFPDAPDSLIEELGLQDGVPSSVSVFLLEKDGIRILFDAGNGTPDSRIDSAFKLLGLSHDDIDYVYITHLHGDHIGGLLKDGNAIFHNAEIHISSAEFEGWMAMPSERNAQQRALETAYGNRIVLFDGGDILPGGVEAVAAYGHTPGHTVFRVGSLLIAGDILHGAALQRGNPEICAAFDMDKEAAVASRRMVLKYVADNELVMIGMHFPAPVFE